MDNVQMMSEPIIHITEDEMEAYLNLPTLPAGQYYLFDHVMEVIERAGVIFGVNRELVDQMIRENVFNRSVCIAKGVPVVDGVDGFYQYNFNTELDSRPEVHQDGTVDYWSIHAVEIVEEGQVIALYTEPKDGQDGVTVKGKPMKAKRGRPMPPLTGRGFERSADNLEYKATLTGKIEMNKNHILVSPVYEVSGDVDMHTGNIEFRGDVIVHGNVTAGFSVKATGSVTVDGTCESCTIEAGKDIILRGGMLGGHKAVIKSKGNIYARFIEYATVEAEGFLDANYALSCNITCYDKIYMSGRHANIIGGAVYGAGGVETVNLGNNNEVGTEVQVGVGKEMLAEMATLENQLSTDNEIIRKINEGIEQFDEAAKARNEDLHNDARRVALLRTRIMKQADVAKAKEAQTRLKGIMEHAEGATVRVLGDVFPGVRVYVNTSSAKLKDTQREVEFIERMGKVIMIGIHDL